MRALYDDPEFLDSWIYPEYRLTAAGIARLMQFQQMLIDMLEKQFGVKIVWYATSPVGHAYDDVVAKYPGVRPISDAGDVFDAWLRGVDAMYGVPLPLGSMVPAK